MIFRAPEPPVAVPDVPLTPFLLARAAGRGDKPAFIESPGGRTLTYRGWAEAVRKAAAGLAQRGVRKGDVVGIYSPNLPEYAVAFHAVSLLGAVNTTINPLYTVTELRAQLRDCGALHVVTAEPFLAKVQQVAAECGLREVFVFGEGDGATPFASLLDATGEPPAVSLDPREDLIVLPYSSGTTGLPKGVMLTHHNLVANVLQAACALGVGEADTMLAVLPFFHIYGMVVIMNLGLHVGATCVTMARFDLEQCLETLQRFKVTFAPVVPPIVLALARHPMVDKYNLGSLHTVFSGAAPLAEHVAMAASARLGCRVLQGYGLTEMSPVTHVTRVNAERTSPGGIGQPIPNTEAKIVALTTGEELGPNQAGEICVRGPQMMKGYLNRPEATAAMIDADGWLHTGDVGYADDSGCFFVVDRVKELIKYKGLQIAPAELEAVLLSHAAVADAAVVPLPDEEAGQVPKGFVVLKAPATAEQIMAYVAERVAPFKKLRSLEIIEQIPKSASGKILRRVLVERDTASPV
ncbi:MAG: AMP-binding protein [Acidobacteria bacterium]|nr:AMP-binding protein [Acidobacteriota bacterium]